MDWPWEDVSNKESWVLGGVLGGVPSAPPNRHKTPPCYGKLGLPLSPWDSNNPVIPGQMEGFRGCFGQ